MALHVWRHHQIDVQLHACAGAFFLGAGFVAVADGYIFYPNMLEFSLTTSNTPFLVIDNGQPVPGIVRSDGFMWTMKMKYIVYVGQEEVGRGSERVRGWAIMHSVWILILLMMLFAALGVLACLNTYFF